MLVLYGHVPHKNEKAEDPPKKTSQNCEPAKSVMTATRTSTKHRMGKSSASVTNTETVLVGKQLQKKRQKKVQETKREPEVEPEEEAEEESEEESSEDSDQEQEPEPGCRHKKLTKKSFKDDVQSDEGQSQGS